METDYYAALDGQILMGFHLSVGNPMMPGLVMVVTVLVAGRRADLVVGGWACHSLQHDLFNDVEVVLDLLDVPHERIRPAHANQTLTRPWETRVA